ncbi:hypothetical protein [Actinomycetospora sp. NBRC 106375]|uniref:hypothetical protein n=1 Tax=Actinomycetospora sp. NBRC 106375 TaxID=3032207 RepID=UPI00255311F7|nr:hypothetical protein [Actinomycetospora sp. NBRC 106375]
MRAPMPSDIPARVAARAAAPVVAPVAPVPGPAHRSGTPTWMGWTVAVAGLLVAGLLVAVGVLVLRPTTVTVAAPAPVSTTTTRTVVPTVTGGPGDLSGYRSSTDTEATSTSLLSEATDANRGQVEALVGSWVPQLSSKRVGTVADGITYDSTDILSHYNQLSDRYGPVLLLDSTDWPVFREGGYWVVVAAQPFATADQANAWCSAQGLSADDCFAKRLAHTGSSADNTEPRG